MPTQSNRQTQSVKVVVNNRLCCEEKKKRRRHRRAPQRSQVSRRKETSKEGDAPPLEEVPITPSPQFTKGLSAYPVRPSIYAPTTQMIQPQSGLNQVPLYFEKQFTNQQATLDELKKQLDDVQNNSSLAIFSNPLFQSRVSAPLGMAVGKGNPTQPEANPTQHQPTPDEIRRDLATAQNLLGEYESTETRASRKKVLKERMNTVFDRHQIPRRGMYQNRVAQLEGMVNDLREETETPEDMGFSLFD